MVADVVGYSWLIRADEEGTIAALKDLRAGLINPKIAQRHGRIVELTGNGMLAEFSNVVDAVCAAVETQQALAGHNSGLQEQDSNILNLAPANPIRVQCRQPGVLT